MVSECESKLKISDSVHLEKHMSLLQELEVDVYAPDWMSVDTVRVYENGSVPHPRSIF